MQYRFSLFVARMAVTNTVVLFFSWLLSPCLFGTKRTITILYFLQFRSPEEYEYSPQTEKVDIYSFGNVLYGVLTGKYPFEKEKSKKARNMVKEGERPIISSSIQKSKDPFDRAMIEAIEMCWIQNPKKRASAREVQKFVLSELQKLGVHED